MPSISEWWVRSALTLLITSTMVCADPGGDEEEVLLSHDTESAEALRTEVRYHLTWEWGSAEETLQGWRVHNDRGYLVEVEEGSLVSYSVQLAPCSRDDLEPGRSTLRFWGSGLALAGHGGVEDPSAWSQGIAESLKSPEDVILDPVELSGGVYCRAHYLVAKAETKTLNLPSTFNMVGTSLYIKGQAIGEDGQAWPFTIWSTLPIGELLAWTTPVSAIDLSRGSVDVVITRDLGTLFDGVNFATMESEAMEKTILLGLAQRLRVEVTQP